MRLKLYRGASMAEVLAQVRAELGPDALILRTRRIAGAVEMSVAVDPADIRPAEVAPAPAAEPDPVEPEADEIAAPAETAWPRLTETRRPILTAPMLATLERPRRSAVPPGFDPFVYHGIPAALAEQLRPGPLAEMLQDVLTFGTLPTAWDDAPLLLAGPPGAGKTLTVARLATRLVLAGSSPLVITADGRRAGATEQLAAFTRLLGLNLVVATHPATLGRALARREGGAPVLIDTPGTDPFDRTQRDELEALVSTAGAAIALVLPGGVDAGESADLGGGYADLGATMLVATRLDLARRLGGVLAAAEAGPLALTEAGTGPGASDGLVPLTPDFLAERLRHARPPDARCVPPARSADTRGR